MGSDVLLVLIVVLVLVVVWRGPKTLPELGKALGRGVREARKEASDTVEEMQAKTDDSSTEDQGGSGS